MKESMQGKMVTLLRIPLIHNCAYYDDSEAGCNVLVYFTISESIFKRVLDELSNELDEREKWVIEDLTSFELDEIQNEAELHSMRYVFDKVYKTKDLLRKEIVYPKEFDLLYEKYLQNNGVVIDKLERKWKVGDHILSKEDFMWASYYEQYSQVEE